MCPKLILECPAPEVSAVSLAWPSFLWLELEPSTAFPTLSPLLPRLLPLLPVPLGSFPPGSSPGCCLLVLWVHPKWCFRGAPLCPCSVSLVSPCPQVHPAAPMHSVGSIPPSLCLGDASPLSTPDYVTGQLFLMGRSHYPGPWPFLGHQYVFAEEVSERPQSTGAKLRCTHSSRCTQGACRVQTRGTGAAVGRLGGSSAG